MVIEQFKIYYAKAVLAMIAAALLTSVAGINLGVLLLLLVTPWFWRGFTFEGSQNKWSVQFLVLIGIFCVWDVVTNLCAGASVGHSLLALQHDLRTFAFVLLLWPVFKVEEIARFALLALLAACVLIAGANLIATWTGIIHSGEYLWPTMHHLHGQMSVGMVFLLAQLWLTRPSLSWRVAVPLFVLLASMLFANERRAGYLLLGVGFPVWYALNAKRLFVGRYRWWVLCAAIVAFILAAVSPVVQARMARMVMEVNQFFAMTPEQRAGVETSLGIRLQFYSTIAQLIQQSHWMIGVGSVYFADLFYAINHQLGTTSEQAATYFSNFQNPHNEYLFMLATKGVVGLALYLAIFTQACRVAWHKHDEVQRVSCLMFVFLFMVSITANSMMTDMEEGHFTMLILLIFLAPVSLSLFKDHSLNH